MLHETTYKSAEDKEDHEEAADGSFAGNVAVADGRHSDQREVNAFPIRRRMVLSIHLRKRVLHLLRIHVALDI